MLSCFALVCRAGVQKPMAGTRWMSSALFDDLVKRLNLTDRIEDLGKLEEDMRNPNSDFAQQANKLFGAASAEEQARFLREIEEESSQPLHKSGRARQGLPADELEEWIKKATETNPELSATKDAASSALSAIPMKDGSTRSQEELDRVFEEEKKLYLESLRSASPESLGGGIDSQTLGMFEQFFLNMRREDIGNPSKIFEAAARDIGASEEVFRHLSEQTGINKDDLVNGSNTEPSELLSRMQSSNFQEAVREVSASRSHSEFLTNNMVHAEHLLRNSSTHTRSQILATVTPAGETQRLLLRGNDATMASLFNSWSDDELQAFLMLRMSYQDCTPAADVFDLLDDTVRGRADHIATTVKTFKNWFSEPPKHERSRLVEGFTIDEYDELKQRFGMQSTNPYTVEQVNDAAEEFAKKKLRAEYSEEQFSAASQYFGHPAFEHPEPSEREEALRQLTAQIGEEGAKKLTDLFPEQVSQQQIEELNLQINHLRSTSKAMKSGLLELDPKNLPENIQAAADHIK